MGVKKFRSVEDMPGPAPRTPLDPDNLRLAFGLMSLAHGLHPIVYTPGVKKFRSWEEALESREAAERAQRQQVRHARRKSSP